MNGLHGRGRLLAVLAGLLVGLTLLAPPPDSAQAHALLDRSFPEPNAELVDPPRFLELFFTEPLESGFSTIRLVDSLGNDVPISPAVVDPADRTRMTADLSLLDPGIYTVVWQSLSQVDGHEWIGSFPFTVLNPDGSPPSGSAAEVPGGGRGELPTPVEAVSRWIAILGGVFLFGAPLFFLVVVLPVEPARRAGSQDLLVLQAARLALLAVCVGALAAILGGLIGVANQAIRLGGLQHVIDLVLGTRSGTLALARSVLAFSALLIALTLPQPRPLLGRGGFTKSGRPLLWMAGAGYAASTLLLAGRMLQGDAALALAFSALAILGLALAAWSRASEGGVTRAWQALLVVSAPLLLTFSLGSHAGAVEGAVWAVGADFLHMAAASAWAAGLFLLALLLVWLRRTAPDRMRTDGLEILLRFSRLAILAVFTIIATGVFSSLVEIPDLESLFTTPYGRVLLLKLLLVGTALAIAFLNNRLVHGRSGALERGEGGSRIGRQVGLEVAVSMGILLAAAVLVQTPAPRPLAGPAETIQPDLPFNTLGVAGDLYVHMKVTPNQVGENEFWVHLYHADGSPIGEVQLVRLSFDYAQAQLGASQIDLATNGLDVFKQTGANLSQSGPWDVSVYVRRRGMDDVLGNLSVEVRSAAGASAPPNPWGNPIPGLPPLVVAGGALAFLGAIPIVWGRTASRPGRRRMPLTLAGDLALFLGLTMVAGGAIGFFLQERLTPDRVPPTGESIAAGEALYFQECSVCHGETGRGDGPLGLTLQPPPAVLQAHVPLHPDEELYGFIAKGFPNTAMRAFERDLSAEEIWNLVNYLRDRFGELAVPP